MKAAYAKLDQGGVDVTRGVDVMLGGGVKGIGTRPVAARVRVESAADEEAVVELAAQDAVDGEYAAAAALDGAADGVALVAVGGRIAAAAAAGGRPHPRLSGALAAAVVQGAAIWR